MSRLDVVMLLKEALRRQHFDHDNFQLVRSEVASYLTSRYSQKSAVSQEANQFREVRHEKLKQKLTEKKQSAMPLVNNQRTRPKTLLHVLANCRAQGSNPEEAKFSLLRQFSQKTEGKELLKSSSEPSIPTPKNADDTGEEKLLTALSSSQLLRKAIRAPWHTFRSPSGIPVVTSDNMNPTTEMKKIERNKANLRTVAARSTKLSALGEATLRAVRERKEKKEHALAIAKMEARQAKIAELKARAEAALNKAKEVLSGLG